MAEWIDLPVLVDDDLIHADLFQDIWENMYNLKNLRYAEVAFDGGGGGINSNATTTFVDVSTSLVRLLFESFGGDFMVGVMVNENSSAGNGGGKVRFELDGVAYGNADGMMNIQNYSAQGFQQTQLLYLFRNIAAGEHTVDLQFAQGASNGGTFSIYVLNTRFKFWVVEFQ